MAVMKRLSEVECWSWSRGCWRPSWDNNNSSPRLTPGGCTRRRVTWWVITSHNHHSINLILISEEASLHHSLIRIGALWLIWWYPRCSHGESPPHSCSSTSSRQRPINHSSLIWIWRQTVCSEGETLLTLCSLVYLLLWYRRWSPLPPLLWTVAMIECTTAQHQWSELSCLSVRESRLTRPIST